MKKPRLNRLAVSRGSKPELATAFRQLLEHKYNRILLAAQWEWERRFGGSDPSDACVTVRISGCFAPTLRDVA